MMNPTRQKLTYLVPLISQDAAIQQITIYQNVLMETQMFRFVTLRGPLISSSYLTYTNYYNRMIIDFNFIYICFIGA